MPPESTCKTCKHMSCARKQSFINGLSRDTSSREDRKTTTEPCCSSGKVNSGVWGSDSRLAKPFLISKQPAWKLTTRTRCNYKRYIYKCQTRLDVCSLPTRSDHTPTACDVSPGLVSIIEQCTNYRIDVFITLLTVYYYS